VARQTADEAHIPATCSILSVQGAQSFRAAQASL
jgi:hypothetical protein